MIMRDSKWAMHVDDGDGIGVKNLAESCSKSQRSVASFFGRAGTLPLEGPPRGERWGVRVTTSLTRKLPPTLNTHEARCHADGRRPLLRLL